MKECSWILLDTKTTGFKPPIYALELGAQKMLGWLPDGPSFHRVLNHNVAIPPEVTRVNGYTRDILERDGVSPHDAYVDFASYAGALPLVAYNVDHDLDKVLIPEWKRLGIETIGMTGFCALKLAQRLLDPMPAGNCKLHTLRQYYRLPDRGAHTALGGVETVAALMQQILRPLAEQNGLQSWEDLVAYTSGLWFPSLIAFGKFKDRNFAEAKDDTAMHAWLEWLAASDNERSSMMGHWYLNQLDKDANSTLANWLPSEPGPSNDSGLAIFHDPEVETLQRLIAGSRDRLADLQSEYTQDLHHVNIVQSQLFSLLRPLYEKRDQLRLKIQYQQRFIDTLLSNGEEEAESLGAEYENARSETGREYEKAAEQAADRQELNGDEESEMKALYRKLVRLYHPDRFAQDPDKQSAYTQLMSDINHARDHGDTKRLLDIANDVNGYIARHGLDSLDFDDNSDLSKLRVLYDSLQIQIISALEDLQNLRESSGFKLFNISLTRSEYIEELAKQQAVEISAEINELSSEASQLAEEIENLTGREGYLAA